MAEGGLPAFRDAFVWDYAERRYLWVSGSRVRDGRRSAAGASLTGRDDGPRHLSGCRSVHGRNARSGWVGGRAPTPRDHETACELPDEKMSGSTCGWSQNGL